MLKHLVVAASLVCVQAAAVSAQQWQRTTPSLTVTKTLLANGTRLDLVHRTGDHLTVEIDFSTGALQVTRNNDRRPLDSPERLMGAHGTVAASPAVRAFRKMAAAHQTDESSDGELIRLEDTLLAVLSGDQTAVPRHADHMRLHHGSADDGLPRGRFDIVGVSYQPAARRLIQSTNTCWADYSVDAIRFADDFVRCRAATSWYDVIAAWGCDAEYVTRAEAAWAWLWACNSRGGGTRG